MLLKYSGNGDGLTQAHLPGEEAADICCRRETGRSLDYHSACRAAWGFVLNRVLNVRMGQPYQEWSTRAASKELCKINLDIKYTQLGAFRILNSKCPSPLVLRLFSLLTKHGLRSGRKRSWIVSSG